MAIFLRRLRKYPNIRGLMSSELMLKIFQEDTDVKLRNAINTTQQLPPQASSSTSSQSFQPVISVNDLFGSDEEKNRQRDEEDELTENSTDFEDDEEKAELLEDGEIGFDFDKTEKENYEFMELVYFLIYISFLLSHWFLYFKSDSQNFRKKIDNSISIVIFFLAKTTLNSTKIEWRFCQQIFEQLRCTNVYVICKTRLEIV